MRKEVKYFIKENAAAMTAMELADALGVTHRCIRYNLKKFGMEAKDDWKRITEKDRTLVIQNPHLTIHQMCLRIYGTMSKKNYDRISCFIVNNKLPFTYEKNSARDKKKIELPPEVISMVREAAARYKKTG